MNDNTLLIVIFVIAGLVCLWGVLCKTCERCHKNIFIWNEYVAEFGTTGDGMSYYDGYYYRCFYHPECYKLAKSGHADCDVCK